MNRFILLSFDVEEFDIPLEYNYYIDLPQQMQIGKAGLEALMPVLDLHAIETTMFTTANFAMYYPNHVKQLSKKHEIASHTFYHSTFKNADLLASRLKLEEIIGLPVLGLRMPRMQKVNIYEVKKAGYNYDSSINPTWLPGRYNNLHLPRTLYNQDGLHRLPASVSPNLRLPLFWLSFKNFPYHYFKKIVLQTLVKDGYVCLYFHPWEFTNIDGFNLPKYVKRYAGEPLQERLNRLIKDLMPHAEFISIGNYLHQKTNF